MKVWFPTIRGTSGTDVFTRRQADALQRRGITTEVTWFPATYEFAPYLLRSAPAPAGTQLIHTNSWNGFAFQRPGIPLIVTEQLGVSDPMARSYKSPMQKLYHETLIRRFTRASFRKADAITAVSEFTASGVTRAFGAYSISVIYNWVNTKRFSLADSRGSKPRQPFRLLFMGNPSKRKGADSIPNMISLGKLSEDSQLQEAYHRCDALLFPSRFEGLPHAPLEAMACGKPVIAADSSSLAEVVDNGVTGILCPTDDVPAFVAACRKLADNRQLASRYGAAARHRVEDRFSEEVVIPQYISLYETLISGGHPTQANQ